MGGTARKQRINGIETRERILKEGARQLSEFGSGDVSIGKISENVGISRRALYHHFASKAALLAAIEERQSEQFEAVLSQYESEDNPFLVIAMTAALNPELIRTRLESGFSGSNEIEATLDEIEQRFLDYHQKSQLRNNVDIKMSTLLAFSGWYGALLACDMANSKKGRIEQAKRYAKEFERTFREGTFL